MVKPSSITSYFEVLILASVIGQGVLVLKGGAGQHGGRHEVRCYLEGHLSEQ